MTFEGGNERLVETIFHGSSLEDVAEGIAGCGAKPNVVYVERRGTRFRWSPAHRGGPYPLHREVAKLIGVPHHRFPLPFFGVDGHSVVHLEPSDEIEAWAWLETAGDATSIADKLSKALGTGLDTERPDEGQRS